MDLISCLVRDLSRILHVACIALFNWFVGVGGFIGSMNAGKYISITKASKATATRNLQYLLEQGILVVKGGGRSTHYELNMD